MSLSIHTNAVQMTTLRMLSMAMDSSTKIERKLASGKSVSTAYDDGATFATSGRIDTNVQAINAINERLNNSKANILKTTTAVSHMSKLSGDIRKMLVKLADTSMAGKERENYNTHYKRLAGEILDKYNSLLDNGTSLLSDMDFKRKVYTSAEKVINNVDGRQTSIGEYDSTGSSLTVAGFTDPNGTSGARNKEDVAQWFQQVFLDTGVDLVADVNGGGFLAEDQTIATPDAQRAKDMIDDSGSSTYRLSQFEDSLSRAMSGLYKDLRSVQNSISFNKDISDANQVGLGAILDADLAKESARLQAVQVREQMARESLSMTRSTSQVILGLLV